jgi:transposase
MSNQIVAGIDIHKDFLVVTVLREHDKFAKEYGTEYLSLCKLKRWLAKLKVSQIAIEATGVYMVQCLDLLKDRFEMYLVNAADTKHIPGKKTDLIDSHWLATLLQKGLLRKSYIAPRVWREIRELVRQRIAQTQTRTRVKNRLHKILVQEGFYISRIFTDIMGGTSRLVIEELVAGLNINVKRIPGRISKIVDVHPPHN